MHLVFLNAPNFETSDKCEITFVIFDLLKKNLAFSLIYC